MMKPNVVDISHYEDVRDWDAVKAFGILGVINKASEGPGNIDKTFAIRRKPVLDRGLLYAGYHFLRPGSPTAQVRHFLDVVGPTDGIGLALDHEDARVPLANARAFCECLKNETGRFPWLYSGFLIKQQLRTSDYEFWRQIPLWLSHYSAHPTWPTACWPKPFLIQFTGDGAGPGPHNVPGIHFDGDGIDINWFDGTAEELAAQWAPAAAAPVNVTPAPVNEPHHPGRQTGIVATCFGGPGDANHSAYGGEVDPDMPGVALPSRFRESPRPKVRVIRGAKSVVCDIVDIGPHNTFDQYWLLAGVRPLAERQRGNNAGIDLTPAVFAALGIAPSDPEYGLTKIDWEFV